MGLNSSKFSSILVGHQVGRAVPHVDDAAVALLLGVEAVAVAVFDLGDLFLGVGQDLAASRAAPRCP